jgi:superoxide dismutase, Fe-Mn family
MKEYSPIKFEIPELKGISPQTIEEHLKLYEGYVKHVNVIRQTLDELFKEPEKNMYQIGEVQRRLGFEFCGMKNHEYYFKHFEGGAKELPSDSPFASAVNETFGSTENFKNRLKTLAKTRGVGWAMLYFDHNTDALLTFWIDEQHLGHPTGLTPILALDMWEHSYMLDYPPSKKAEYIDAFFENLNWETAATFYDKAKKD